MYFSDYEIERIVKEILNRLGKEVDIKANLRYSEDDEYYDKVKGLEYHFDKMNIVGYYYNYNYYFSVQYNYLFQKPYGCYLKRENGNIENKNENIWKTYLLELYNSLDDLERNEEAKEQFFSNYGKSIPWKEFSSYFAEEVTKNYIREINITLVAKQWLSGTEMNEINQIYKIYDGAECVYDSKANLFIPGDWESKLAKYIIDKKRKKEYAESKKMDKTFNDSLKLLKKIRND